MKNTLAIVVGYLILLGGVGYAITETTHNQQLAAKSRVVTVHQRCELTEIVLLETNGSQHARLQKSLDGCKKQIKKVEAEVK